MKLIALVMLITLVCLTQQLSLNKYSTQNENQFLFNLWKDVPGAGTSSKTTASSVPTKFSTDYADTILDGWLSVSSPSFKDETMFPVYAHPDGKTEILTSNDYTRINEKFRDPPRDALPNSTASDLNSPPGRSFFWFRLNKQYLYFTESITSNNVLGQIDWNNKVLGNSIHFTENPKCFNFNEKNGNTWKYCGKTHEDAKKFVCRMQTMKAVPQDPYCQGMKPADGSDSAVEQPSNEAGQIVEKIITQPYILIPLPREQCNAKWDYSSNGNDWKCLCKEGNKINLQIYL